MLRRRKETKREVPAWKVAMERTDEELPPAHKESDRHDAPKPTAERDLRKRSRSRSASRERKSVSADATEQSEVPPHSSPDVAIATDLAKFVAASRFEGARAGYTFRLGTNGLGYYIDAGSHAAATAAEASHFQCAAVAAGLIPASGGASAAARDTDETHTHDSVQDGATAPLDGPDAPILAALASHEAGLEDTEDAAANLERDTADWGGRVSSSVRHRAEVLEVRLTDQLQQLTTMLDDCATPDGRSGVKRVIGRLRALGRRLLRLSQGTGT